MNILETKMNCFWAKTLDGMLYDWLRIIMEGA